MTTASVTSKGQVTIPARIRRLLGLKPGDLLLFETEGEEVRLRAVPKQQLSEFLGALPVTRPFPGKDEVRNAVAASLAARRKASKP